MSYQWWFINKKQFLKKPINIGQNLVFVFKLTLNAEYFIISRYLWRQQSHKATELLYYKNIITKKLNSSQ